MAFEYLSGITVNRELCQNATVSKLVARMMAKIHKIDWHENNSSKEPQVWNMLERFIELIPDVFSDSEKELR